jgi:hypothetical protein
MVRPRYFGPDDFAMKRITFFAYLGLAALFAACSTNGTDGEFQENQPPTVWLSAGPPEGSTSSYRVQMYWGGWDPDGEIAGYEYIVTDNQTSAFNPADTVGTAWRRVSGNSSTFTFSADEEVDTLNTTNLNAVFTRSHTFFIRAIDSQGLRSVSPAHRSFTSRTLSPDVMVQVPIRNFFNPAEVPPVSTFRWIANDYVDDFLLTQEPDSVQWVLIDTNDPVVPNGGIGSSTQPCVPSHRGGAIGWQPWVWYGAPDSGKFWTTPRWTSAPTSLPSAPGMKRARSRRSSMRPGTCAGSR